MSKYIVTGGGTGGHLYPGLMIARELAKEGEVIYVASKNGIDYEIISGQDIDFEVKYWDLRGFSRSFALSAIIRNLVTLFKLVLVSIKSIMLLLKFRPDTVIGVGGYISFPLVFFGKLVGAKTVIHEQNSFPGVTNRQLGKRVDTVMATYQSSKKYFDERKLVMTSNPRIDIASEYIGKKFYDVTGMNQTRTNILVVGGSLGAEVLNETIIELAKVTPDKDFYLVCGNRYADEYKGLNIENLKIISYLDQPFEYFATADVVVSRAGATTLLELIAMEKLVVAVPSPNVVANHQVVNAKEFSRECMIKLIREENLDLEVISNVINDIIENKDSYIANVQKNKPVNAMEQILKICK
ncbi:UDP-N-acetylglucosamine--N-acetylmuramyl-(pentapeptide) pyrophosphoryl-undecaprenol N-acetylglucosamine transferase [Mollicutes bacterium LVI A0078]|nr:UDP-N-acetylglucosamine--N-acetylmuramyl-(pentapeptide) pyrophosphoryl-undecaprenol N-acetylglucosamine transferase [Mollicutes bacterium LVI A0075]WOO90317.1 UDP-N-acetylglucosamine--N-acetylmuramyl-(pentapeptide) pyrophosphoryl-undecaprenol N-acetylglucosamine transferase [Mollicutes bacterium LVI A0078]